MLEGMWIALLCVTVVFQIIALYEKSIIFSIFTVMFWLVLMINTVNIEWPYYSQVYNVSANMTETSSGVVYFVEEGIAMLFIGFIFINIIWAAIQIFDLQERNKLP